MSNRPDKLTAFIETASRLFQSNTLPNEARSVAAKVFERLETVSDDGLRYSTRFPACNWLGTALAQVINDESLVGDAARAIAALEPTLGWSQRNYGLHGTTSYVEGHVHGMICGPGGPESRHDVLLGFSVLTPNIQYPDHSHPPEEAYVLLSPGEFRQQDGDFFDPGIGGGIYNRPGAVHAMRSNKMPFLAIWCLLV